MLSKFIIIINKMMKKNNNRKIIKQNRVNKNSSINWKILKRFNNNAHFVQVKFIIV